ncbi:MAG: hypothetical protein QM762_04475 [Chryseolinea sp.]
MRSITTIGLILFSHLLQGQPILPKWGQEKFSEFANRYVRAKYIAPQFLEADFSGDGNADLAILIERKTNKKKGILILLANSNKAFVIGAGTKFGNAGDNFKWANVWSVFSEKVTHETTFKPDGDVEGGKKVTLERPAIAIKEEEGSGGLIYFNGKQFIWIHQGD